MNLKRKPFSAFLIAGTNSGSGKTTLSLGILRAFSRRGLVAAPFKCGPDYIDPLFHRQAAGRISVNCDPFLMRPGGVRRSFSRHVSDSCVAVVEGVMGLFDGNSPGTLAGSSAEIAALLDIPVVLVVNARGMAGSIAPLVRGFRNGSRVSALSESLPTTSVRLIMRNCCAARLRRRDFRRSSARSRGMSGCDFRNVISVSLPLNSRSPGSICLPKRSKHPSIWIGCSR